MNDDIYYLARTIEENTVSFLHISDFQGVSEFLEKHSFEVYLYRGNDIKLILSDFITRSFKFTDPLQRTHTIDFFHLTRAVLEAKSAQDMFKIFVKLAGLLPWTIVFWLNVQSIDEPLMEFLNLFDEQTYDIRFVISSSPDVK